MSHHEDKSTPRPWPKAEYDNYGNGSFSEWWEMARIARFYNPADAELTRTAVNSHDALLECVEAARSLLASSYAPFGSPARAAEQRLRDTLLKLENSNG